MDALLERVYRKIVFNVGKSFKKVARNAYAYGICGCRLRFVRHGGSLYLGRIMERECPV